MNFDQPTLDQLRQLPSLKWSGRQGKASGQNAAFAPKTVAMWVAEMDFGLAPVIKDALVDALDKGLTGYFPPAWLQSLPKSCARYQTEHFGWAVTPEDVGLCPDVLSILRAVISATTPGAPVIVPTPGYMPFLKIPGEMGREAIQVPSIQDSNGYYYMDLKGIEKALLAGGACVILCNPWNPTGQSFTRDQLEEFDQLMERFPGVLVFSDEIHAPILIDSSHVPYASICEKAAARTITAVATSKGWNTPGLHCAQWIITNHSLRQRMKYILEPLSRAATPLGALAADTAYSKGQDWLEGVITQVTNNVCRVQDWASERRQAGYGVYVAQSPQADSQSPNNCPPNNYPQNQDSTIGRSRNQKANNLPVDLLIHLPGSTYLSWWEDRGGLFGQNPCEYLSSFGLLVNDGADLGRGYEQCFRFNLGTTTEVLENALTILTQAMNRD